MTPVRLRLTRAVLLALMVLALTTNVAAAHEGRSNLNCVPYDPGLTGQLPSLSPLWELTEQR